jgi:hypothetical protein
LGIGDWGLGIGDWGLGIGPNPQSPIPNPQNPSINFYYFLFNIDLAIKNHKFNEKLNTKGGD